MRKDLFRKGFVIGMIFLFVGASVVPFVGSRTADITSNVGETVYSDWPCNPDIIVPDDYTTIQEAIDAAEPGMCIGVRTGIYYENIVIDKERLTLCGEDRNTTIIDGGGSDHVIWMDSNADDCNISGFTIRNDEKHFTGLYVWSDSSRIENIIFKGCNIGVALRENMDNIVKGNKFTDNNYGVWTWMCTDSSIEDNIIEFNSIDGIALQWSTNIVITGNKIKNNTFDGILQISCSDCHVEDNEIVNNDEFGIQMFSSDNNNIVGNNVNNNFYDGISLHKSNHNKMLHNTILFNKNGTSMWFYSNNNTIFGNTIANNSLHGIRLHLASSNLIYNNFLDNVNNSWDNGENDWNIVKTLGTNIIGGSYIGGNYWSDYTGVDSNGDEIGDTPYSIPGDSNQDNYPLIFDTFPPEIRLDKPTKGYWYLFNNEMWATQSGNTIIIGKIDVEIYAIDYSSGVDRVELFIDDGIWDVTYNQHGQIIYSFLWDETIFGEHTIKAIAYDNRDNTNMTELKVNIFNIHLPVPSG